MRGLMLTGLAIATMATPAWAGDAAELNCVENGYTAQQKAELDRLLGKIDVLGESTDPAMDALGEVVVGAATACMTSFDWSEDELNPAMIYEFGRLMEASFRTGNTLPAGDIAKIDAALGRGDRSALWAVLEEQIDAGMAGEEGDVSDAGAATLGLFIIETGIGTEGTKPELVGVYLTAKAMQRVSARQFTAAQ